MEKAIDAILAALLTPAPSAASQTPVTISIPSDHPQAEKIRKLAAALASRRRLPSGLELQSIAKPGAADEFLDALREVGVDVDAVKERLRPAPPSPTLPVEALLHLSRNVRPK